MTVVGIGIFINVRRKSPSMEVEGICATRSWLLESGGGLSGVTRTMLSLILEKMARRMKAGGGRAVPLI